MASKKHLYTRLGTLLWVLAAIFALLPSWPHLYYRMSPKASQALASTIAKTATTTPPADFADKAEGRADSLPTQPKPIILAAHRWGYLEWTNGFRKLNSFYNLPKIKVGDTIKIVWDQRQFEYKVYAVTSGTNIPEYKANLILYTCQLWNSPVRFFVFANRVN